MYWNEKSWSEEQAHTHKMPLGTKGWHSAISAIHCRMVIWWQGIIQQFRINGTGVKASATRMQNPALPPEEIADTKLGFPEQTDETTDSKHKGNPWKDVTKSLVDGIRLYPDSENELAPCPNFRSLIRLMICKFRHFSQLLSHKMATPAIETPKPGYPVFGCHNLIGKLPITLLAGLTLWMPTVGGQVTFPVTHYVPLQETELRNSLVTLYGSTGNTLQTVISVVMQENGGIIIYDHWEDGYEADINNPVQASTLILGDFIASNGDLSNLPTGVTTYPLLLNDNAISAGTVITFSNSMWANPRLSFMTEFDGGDRISSNRALAVSRAGWALDPGTVLAGAVEVLDTSSYGTQFVIPVGENTSSQGGSGNYFFEMTHLFVQAAENGTSVTVDANGPYVSGGITNTTLNQGQTLRVTGIREGATVTASKKVQSFLLTGDIDAGYESRWYTLSPANLTGNIYYNPIPSASSSDPTAIFLFNPGNSSLNVTYTTNSTSGIISIPAYASTKYTMPVGSGAKFEANQNFLALSVIDADCCAGSSSNQIHDWGMTLLPEDYLTPAFVVGWGPGADDMSAPAGPDANYSPVFLMAVANTMAYVDFDGNPATGILTDPNGNKYDISYNLAPYQVIKLYDTVNNDNDQTGTKVYTLDGVKIVGAWGQDPETAVNGNPALDLGTTVPPSLLLEVFKLAQLNDLDGDNLLDIGESITYRIVINNLSLRAAEGIQIGDIIPTHMHYIPNSTYRNSSNPAFSAQVPDAPNPSTAFPLDEGGFALGTIGGQQSDTIEYRMRGGNTVIYDDWITNAATITLTDGRSYQPEVDFPVDTTKTYGMSLSKEVLAVNGAGMPATFQTIGDTITYQITLTNTGNTIIPAPNVTDSQASSGPTYLSGDTDSNGHLDFNETWIYSASRYITQEDLDAGSFTNIASAAGSADMNGDYIGDLPLNDQDSAIVMASQSPSLSLVKAAAPTTYSAEGEMIAYSFTVTNTGNVTLTSVSVSDPLPGLSAISPASVTLAPGASQIFSATYAITQDDVDAGSVFNTATANGMDPDNNPVSDSDDATINALQNPAIALVKAAAPTTYSAEGEVIAYSFTVTNTGNVTLTSVSVSDPLPGLSAISPASVTLAPGESQIFSATYTITQDDVDAGSVFNTATTNGLDPDNNPVSDADDATINALQNPAIELVKAAAPTTYSAEAEVIAYSFTVTNTGNVTLTSVSVSDPLPGLSAISPASVTLAPGESQIFSATYSITQDDINAGSVFNTATANGLDPDNNPVSDTDDATINALQNPAIALVKAAAPTTYSAEGEVIAYSFTVTNTGNVTLTSVSVSDPLPGLSAISPASVTLAPGESQIFSATYTITQDDINAGSVFNTATANGLDPDNNPVSDTDDATINALQNPAITLVKAAAPTTYSAEGEGIAYSFTVTNTGNVTLTSVSVSDPLPGLSAISPASVTLAPGESQIFSATYTITQDDINAGSVFNTATATGLDPDNNPVSDTDDATINALQNPAIALVKAAAPTTYSAEGEVVSYSFTVTNTGNVTLTSVSISDPLPGLSAINPASVTLAPGESQIFSATYAITQDDIDAGSVFNTATATGLDPDNNPVSDTDDATINALQNPAIALVKAAAPTTYSAEGEVVSYSFTVTNTGNVTLTSVSISDPLPCLSAINPASVTLAPGESQIFSATYAITQDNIDAGSVFNTATATGLDPDNNPVSDTDDATINALQNPAIALVKAAAPTTYSAEGEVIAYSFTVTNTGNVTLTSVSVSDPLPGLSAISPASVTLAPGESQIFSATYTITQDDVNAGSVFNTATATGLDPDNNPVSDTDDATINALQNPAIALVKAAAPTTYSAEGEVIAYSFTVTNTGNVTLTSVSVSDPLPGLSAISPASVTLAPGESQIFSATYTITQDDVDAGSVFNTATATGLDPVNNPVSDTDDATINALQNPAIALVKAAAPTTYSAEGEVIAYSFTVTNTGNVTLTSVSVSDPLPGLSAISPASVTLAPGESQIFSATYTITQDEVDAGSVFNTATATGLDPDNNPVADLDDATINALQNPAIALVKAAAPTTYSAEGEVITYSFTVTNTGNVTLTSVSVSDPLPGLGAISPASVSLAPGESQIFSASYTITQDDVDAGSVFNAATVSGLDPDNNPVSDTDDTTINALQNPAITLVKAAAPTTYSAEGEVIAYSFTVTNTGNVTLTSVSVSDPLPGLSAISPASVTLAPGESQIFSATYTITQYDIDAGSVFNTATANGLDPDNNPVSDTDDATINALQNPAITLVKAAAPTTYSAEGEVIAYSFTVTNTGNVTLTSVSVSDPLPGLSAITPALVTLAPGESQIFSATFTITQDDIDAGSVFNTATATGLDPDNNPVSDTDDATINALQNPAITLVKAAAPTTYSAEGEGIAYSFTVTNTGNVTLTSVSVSDHLPGLSAISPASVTLAPGASQIFSATYAITQDDIDAGSVFNTATATGLDPDNNPVSDSDDATINALQNPAITLVKAAAPTTYSAEGEVIAYSFTVTNTGNVTLTSVSVSDLLPGLGAISPASVTLAPGESQIFSATYTITQDDVDAGSVFNTATATGLDPDNNPVSDADDATINAVQNPFISITKTALDTIYELVGEEISFLLSVQNTGNVTLAPVKVHDPLTGLFTTIDRLAPNEIELFQTTYSIQQEDIARGYVTNVAGVFGESPNGIPMSDVDSVKVFALQNPAIELVKDATPTAYSAEGDVISYSFTVTNTGNVTLTSVSVSDPLPGLGAITPASVTLAPGESQIFSATYTITQDDVDAGSVFNAATANGLDPNNDPVSDADDATINALQNPAIELVKAAAPTTYSAEGDVIAYSFTVTNAGNVTLSSVSVSDPLPGLSTITPASVTLAPGESQIFSATYTITQDDVDAGSVFNTATANGLDPNNDPVSDADDTTINAQKNPAIELVKAAAPTTYSAEGDVIAYSFTVTNTGNVTLSSVSVSDPLPGLSTITPASVTLAPGESQIFTATYTITQDDVNAGSVFNAATATGLDPDNNPVSDSDDATINALQNPAITLVKAAAPTTYSAEGEVIAYSFTVTNTGNVTLTSVSVSDLLPGLGAISPASVTLAPGASQIFSATYTITQDDVNAGSVFNAATANGLDPNNDPVSDADDTTINAQKKPAIELVKTAAPTTYSAAGEVIAYSFTVTNTGNVSLTSVSVSDPLPGLSAISPASVTLAPGESQIFSASYTITQDDVDAGSVLNSATANGLDPDNNPVSGTDDTTINALQNPAIALVKAAVPTTYSTEGEVIAYSFTVTNTGNVTLSSVSVIDPLPGLSAISPASVSLAPGESQIFSASYTITQDDVDAGSVFNAATVSGLDSDNDPVSDTDDTTINALQNPAIALVKAAAPTTYSAEGEVIAYSFTVTNTGNVTLNSVSVSDPLPGLSAISPASVTLAPGESQIFSATYTITQDDVDAGSVFNTATATGLDPDNNPVSDADDATVNALQYPLMGVSKWVNDGPHNNFDGTFTLTYGIRVENMGNVTLNDIQITEDLSAAFGTAEQYQVIQIASSALTVNNLFDGEGDLLLLSGSDQLAVGEDASLELTIVVKPGINLGPYMNTVVGVGVTPSFVPVSDLSQNGLLSDPDGDHDPINNDVPTPLSFACLPTLNNLPPDLTLSCEEVNQLMDEVTATSPGCCLPLELTKDVERIDGICADQYTLIITWTATDACGQSISAQQHVTLVDQTAPVFSLVPVSVTVECDNLPLVPEVGTHVIASDLCDSSVKYMTGETVIPGHCKNAFQIVRTWTAIDNCGNSSTAQHSVTVLDTQAPAFENLPSDLTLDCSEAVPAAMGVEVKDNCDAQVSFTLTENQADPGDCTTSTITRVWTATDNCGNATSAIQTVTVKDDQPPFLTGVPADMTVDCHQVPQQAQVVATDDCSDPVALAFHETRQDGSCPGQYSLTRTWVATDACGNETSAQQIVTVVDLSAPQLTGVPADITISCDIELPVAAQVIALDLCDPAVIVQFTESFNGNGSCANGVVVRTWSATDHCGHSVTAVQHITTQDEEGPVLTGVPGDITVACHEVPQPAWVTAFDNCSEPVEISFTENQVAGNCPGNYQLVRTWIASDACGNLTSSQQKITVRDQQAPVITPIHPLLTGTPSGSVLTVNSCQVEAFAIKDIQVYDNCDSDPLVTITETIKDGDCLTDGFLMEQTVTWTVTDACGNASSYHIVIRVGDHTPPVLQGLPASGSFSCDAVPAPAQVTAEDNCGAPVTITFEEKRLNGGCDGEYMLIRTWTATDACGNTASGLQTLKIHDNSGPVITPLHPMIAGQPSGTVFTINCDQVGVMDESDVAAIDNCQADPLVVFSETVKFGQCATDGYLYELTCTWTATDACGNANAYYIIVRVTDSTPPLLVGVPADETVDCDVVLSPALVLAEDNCGDPVTMNLDFEQKDGACLGEYQIIRTWTATDGCGNTATGQQTISVLDTKAPIITPSHPMIAGQPSGTVFTITCDQVGVMNENDVSVTDKCHVAPSVVFSETVKFGQCVTDGYLYEMTCTWTATDDCGNASEYFIVVRVTDQQAPVLSDVPSDVTVDMTAGDTLPEVSVPAVTDDCDQDPEVVLEETVILQPCGYLLVRTWTATDDCGNSLQGTQHITVKEACPCDLPVLRQWEVRHPDCGAWNGAIAIDMENDTTDYVFEWHPAVGQANANGNERTNLPPGSYTVKVFANGQEDCYLLLDTALVVQGSCVDTVYVEIPQDTPYEVCLDQVLDLVGPIGSATTCGFQVSAIESVVTESAGDCVLIDPVNGFTGTTTICVIHCDQASPSTCDTTYIFVTIPQAAPPCPILFSDSELEIQSTSCDQQAPVCLAVDRSLFQGYVWQMDGKAMSGIPAPCHVDTMVSYQAEEMPDMGLDGPYMLESWIMDGITYQGEFLNVTDLTALLTQWDPAGQWQWDSLNGTLTGGRPGGTYGHMEITQLSTGATSSLFPVKRIRKSGVVFNLNEGVHYLQISHPGTACKEEMWITVLCEDEEDLLAVSDSATTRKNKSVKIRVLSNDIFNPLSLAEVVILDLPAHGQVGVLHDLDVLYTPEQDFCGQDSFTYQLCTDAGCDTATVYVDVQCSGFVVHTGFSPNGDGINDRFTITGIEDFPGNELTVFNRWGNQVFHQKGYKNNWDGTWNGSTLPDGTYFYFLDDGDGHTHTGYVQIHR